MENEIKSNKRFIKWIYFIPIIAMIITVIIVSTVFIIRENNIYKKEIALYQKRLINLKRSDIEDRVNKLIEQIIVNKQIIEDESKDNIKNLVNFAYKIIQNIYKKNKNLSHKKIIKIIKSRLQNMRFFNDLSGYFFIYDMNGTCILLPSHPSLEGKNNINIKDSKGVEIIKSAINKLKIKNATFDSWYWYKPGSKKMYKKIGYYKVFKPLNIFVGSAFYEDDIMKEVKTISLKIIQNYRYADKGYIFAYTIKGRTLSHIKKSYIGKNRLNMVVHNRHILKDMIKGAIIDKEGFFIHYIASVDPKTKKPADKISFVKIIPKFNWLIGTGFYTKSILKQRNNRYAALKKQLRVTIENIIILSIIMMILLGTVMVFVSNKLKEMILKYESVLLKGYKEQSHHARHDTLTMLPNRFMFNEVISSAMLRSQRDKKILGLIYMDLDGFKDVNDLYGHDIGDELLKGSAKRFKKMIRVTDYLFRFGGDEFVILLTNCRDENDVALVADKIIASFLEPFHINNYNIRVGVSMGITLYPNDADKIKDLLRNADIAMYKAKEEGKNKYVFFQDKMYKRITKRHILENNLKEAIKNDEFILYYQPQVDGLKHEIVGLEALIRWKKGSKIINPSEFIKTAEQCNLINNIGEIVMNKAMNFASKLQKNGLNIGVIAINLADKQLKDKNLLKTIDNALKHNKCDSKLIEFEITEGFIMSDLDSSYALLKDMKKMGLSISIDDFGTGYSSLSYLKNLPFDVIKIDRSFVIDIPGQRKDEAIVKSIIELAKGLSLEVIAEGAEEKEQEKFLINEGCFVIQGYLYSKPLPENDIISFIKNFKKG